MKMKQVRHKEFDFLIEKIGAELVGQDVGRTHGIFSYEREGKFVASSNFYRTDSGRVWTYEIANYLYEAYLK